MSMMRSPLVTLAAAAAVGVGVWFVNVSNQPAAPETTAAAAAAPVVEAPAPAFAPTAGYAATIPTRSGTISLDISVDGQWASAYACDSYGVETWLSGSAAAGSLRLSDKAATSRLDGRLEGDDVVGTLTIDRQQWNFTATPVPGDGNAI